MLPKKTLAAGLLSLTLTTPALADEHIVIVTGFSYFPAITFAQPGDTVRFINQSGRTETVVGRDTGWVIGPLDDLEEGELTITEETELAFFSAYKDCENSADGSDGNCGLGDEEPAAGDDGSEPYGNYEEATIKAEISFDPAPVEATAGNGS